MEETTGGLDLNTDEASLLVDAEDIGRLGDVEGGARVAFAFPLLIVDVVDLTETVDFGLAGSGCSSAGGVWSPGKGAAGDLGVPGGVDRV